MRQQETPQIHAGSMADIAFLLLIFFLVTTTIPNDQGILKRLPKNQEGEIEMNRRNVLEISLNSDNQLLLEGTRHIEITELKDAIRSFIDNGSECDYCDGAKEISSSDHPSQAVLEFESSETAAYGAYVAVHNEINKAYNELRNSLAQKKYGRSLDELRKALAFSKNKDELKTQLAEIRDSYPMQISEIRGTDFLNN